MKAILQLNCWKPQHKWLEAIRRRGAVIGASLGSRVARNLARLTSGVTCSDTISAQPMSEDPFDAPNHPPTTQRTPTPARHAWSLWKDGARTDCELRIQGEYGVVDLLRDGFS